MIVDTVLREWENRFIRFFEKGIFYDDDAAHDLGHVQRVARLARQIGEAEGKEVDQLILLASAYFHDIINLPKNHPERKKASSYSAMKAKEILSQMGFPEDKLEGVSYAILMHSYSLGMVPETLEAKCLQDADRLEALGALGAMRCFYISGKLGTKPFNREDLFAKHRALNDTLFALDHFYTKLFKLPGQLCTSRGKEIGERRAAFLVKFVEQLAEDLIEGKGEALLIAQLCHSAGMQGKHLFSSQDPFAEKRMRGTGAYVIDTCLDHFSPASFILNQLREELGTSPIGLSSGVKHSDSHPPPRTL